MSSTRCWPPAEPSVRRCRSSCPPPAVRRQTPAVTSRPAGEPPATASTEWSEYRHHKRSSVVVGKGRPVRRPLLQEGVAALHRLVGHVREPRRLAGEHLLPDQPVVDRVEG